MDDRVITDSILESRYKKSQLLYKFLSIFIKAVFDIRNNDITWNEFKIIIKDINNEIQKGDLK